jgi:hypothetical protein
MSNEKSFARKIVGVFTHPRSTFEAITEKDLTRGFAVVLLVAIVGALASTQYISKMDLSSLPRIGLLPGADASSLRGSLGIAFGVITGIRTVTGWLIPALIIYVVAKLSTGEGGFKRLLAQTGLASTPILIQHVLRLIDAYAIQDNLRSDLLQTGTLTAGLSQRIINQALNSLNLFSLVTIILTIVAASVTFRSSKKKMTMITVVSYILFIALRSMIFI